jgi:PIF1-like helicase
MNGLGEPSWSLQVFPSIYFRDHSISPIILGDYRQCLPVIPHASCEQTVAASLQRTSFWKDVKVLHLTQNMRLLGQSERMTRSEHSRAVEFADWLLQVGDGRVDLPDSQQIQLPPGMSQPHLVKYTRT